MWLRGLACGLSLLAAGWVGPVYSYEGDIHQQLTFIAARQFNDCVQTQSVTPRLSALDSRYIVKANVAQAEGGWFGKVFRWPYYNRADQTGDSTWGVFETRFHDHFDAQARAIDSDRKRHQRLRALGRIIAYIQDVTSPPHVVPVYTGRWWRLSLTDRFNRFALDPERVRESAVSGCTQLTLPERDLTLDLALQEVLNETARDTLQAVQTPIYGYPTTWEAFWKLADKPAEFGEYGRAGNSFGQRTEFRCGEKVNGVRERCLLLEDDPLYRDFAFQRHLAAVIATMRVFMLYQHYEAASEDS